MELYEIIDINGSGYPSNSEELFPFDLLEGIAGSDMSRSNQTDSNPSSPNSSSTSDFDYHESRSCSNPSTPLQSDNEGNQSQNQIDHPFEYIPSVYNVTQTDLECLSFPEIDPEKIIDYMTFADLEIDCNVNNLEIDSNVNNLEIDSNVNNLEIVSNINRHSTNPDEPWSLNRLREIVFRYETSEDLILVIDPNWVRGNSKPKKNNIDPNNNNNNNNDDNKSTANACLWLTVVDSNGNDLTSKNVYTINTSNFDGSIKLNKNHGTFYIKLLKAPKVVHAEWFCITLHVLSADGSKNVPIQLTNADVIASRSRKRVADKTIKNSHKKHKSSY